jgi:hypothetical protein
MNTDRRERRPYRRPQLVIYGTLQDLTFTAPPMSGNVDTTIGSGNLKT